MITQPAALIFYTGLIFKIKLANMLFLGGCAWPSEKKMVMSLRGMVMINVV